ncbi:hypothetical protein KIN20_026893 [Parelaphostrongylus tenuis]|uniref:EGF-like domain-containing protein n=1 Tax=Parelaphostrongylus tenuis TaxID=148309 RepID=A0AAD5WDK2_PARTN|nr:hypothetical protein KIN20_026893 [Parelaphostrongylus tenuis]
MALIFQDGSCTSLTGSFKNINSQCAAGDRCSGGSTCRGHVCQCVDGSFEYHDRCRQSPGSRCTYGQTCDGGSICEFGLCRCPVGNFINGGKCVVSTSAPGKSCQHGQKCLHGSVCRFGMCMCVAKYTASNGRCVRRESILSLKSVDAAASIQVGAVKGPGLRCHDKDLCSGGSHCRDGFCVCNDSEVIINEQCVSSHEQANEVIGKILIAAPGQPCDARTNCTGASKCMNRTCTCVEGVIDDTGTCSEEKKAHSTTAAASKISNDSLQPGTICTLTIECPYRTECLRSVCRCKKGETIVDNTCRKAIHQVLPGGKCDPRKGYDCVGESQCFYGICTCSKHLINNGRECVTMAEMVMVKPGIKCGAEQICSGGARCIDGVCQCPRDEVPDVNKKCVKTSQVYPVFNKFATLNERILPYSPHPILGFNPNPIAFTSILPNPMIREDKMKEFKPNEASLKASPRTPDHGKDQTIYGRICKNKQDCPANAFCFQQLCRCLIGYQAEENHCRLISKNCINSATSSKKPCSEIAYSGMACTSGEICSYNSYCNLVSGVCECPTGMATLNNQCLQAESSMGLSCVTSRNCHRSSYCDNGLCLCKVGYELLNNFCVPITGIPGGNMENGIASDIKKHKPQDVLPILGSSESYATSVLPLDLTTPPFYFSVRPELQINGQNSNSERLPSSSFPHNSFSLDSFVNFPIPFARGATTKSGDAVSEVIKAHPELKMLLPGNFCGSHSICIGNSVCQNRFCRCPSNTFAENGLCTIREQVSLGPRHNDERLTSQEDTGEDRQFASPLENCQNFEFCTGGAECSSVQGMGLICQCPMNTILLEEECVDTPINVNLSGIGESCENGEICLGGSKCVQNICACAEGRRDILGICVKTVRPGDDCSNGQICVDGSVCAASLKVCICPPGRSSIHGRCVEIENYLDLPRESGPGSVCGPHSICTNNSICSEGLCVCKAMFEISDGRCVSSALFKRPGEECFAEHICRAGSECRHHMCTCLNGQILIEGKCITVTSEVRKIPKKQECSADEDCTEHYHCVDRLCVCHGTFSHCLQMIFVGTDIPCSEDNQCAKHSSCNGNVCVCNEGFENFDGRCRPLDLKRRRNAITKVENQNDFEFTIVRNSGPGASCSDTKTCVMGSLCVNGYCVCDINSIPKNGVCTAIKGNLDTNERCSDEYRCRDGFICLLGRCVCHDDQFSCDGVYS